jgi:hypothetical protein
VVHAKWLQGSVRQYRTVTGSGELSFKMAACQDMSLATEELNGVKSLELAVEE